MAKIKKNYISEVKHLSKLKKNKLIESEAFGGARERFMTGKQNQVSHDINLRDEEIIEKIQDLFFNISENSATQKNTQEFLVEFEEFYRLWNANAIASYIKDELKDKVKIVPNESGGKSAMIEFQEGDFDLYDHDIYFRPIQDTIKTLCILSLFPDLANEITSISPDNQNFQDYIANVMDRYIDPEEFRKVKFINLTDCVDLDNNDVITKLSMFPNLETLILNGYTSGKPKSSVHLATLKNVLKQNPSSFFKHLKRINISGKASASESKEIILFLNEHIPTLTSIECYNLDNYHITTLSIFKEINEYNSLNGITKRLKINDRFEGEYPVTEFRSLKLDNQSINELQYYNKGVHIETILLDPEVDSEFMNVLIDHIKSGHIRGLTNIEGKQLTILDIEDVKRLKTELGGNIKIAITLANVNPIVYDAVINKYLKFDHGDIEEFINDMRDVFDRLNSGDKVLIDISKYVEIDIDSVNILKDIFEDNSNNIIAVMLPDKFSLKDRANPDLIKTLKELIELLKTKNISFHPNY